MSAPSKPIRKNEHCLEQMHYWSTQCSHQFSKSPHLIVLYPEHYPTLLVYILWFFKYGTFVQPLPSQLSLQITPFHIVDAPLQARPSGHSRYFQAQS